MMPRGMHLNERQADLFGFVRPPPAPRVPRPRKPPVDEMPAPEPETAARFAERATAPNLAEFVTAIADKALAPRARARARQLRRRLARTGARGAKGKMQRRSPLDRAGAALAAEWATAPDEGTW